MTVQRRAFNSLPSYLQTDRNNLELAVTDDLVYEPEQAKFVSGYIGDTSKLTEEDLARTPLLIENTPTRQKYQFSVAIAQYDPIQENFRSGAFYDDLVNHLYLNGAIIDDPNRIFSSYYYSWSPPIDYDKLVNPAKYYWLGSGTADDTGEYITKEPACSQTVVYRFNGTSLVKNTVTIVDGLPGSGTLGEIVEDASVRDRLLYEWTGVGWGELVFQVADDTTNTGGYHNHDWVYVCRTGPNFVRPTVWVYRPTVGRWVSHSVVVSMVAPDAPVKNMIWEDASVPPARVLRIYDGEQWQPLTWTTSSGPSGTPSVVTYIYDTRALTAVDSWSAQNWWRSYSDLSISDRSHLPLRSQGTRPILEFWGNIEPASGDTRSSRNQEPHFNVYAVAVADSSFEIKPVTSGNFPTLDTSTLTTNGNYVGGTAVTRLFRYLRNTHGVTDPILNFKIQYGSDGTPEFRLDLESMDLPLGTGSVLGYRYFRDTATGYVHCIWERTGQRLTQELDDNGLYEIPKGLKNNPDHAIVKTVSRSRYINHFTSVIRAQGNYTGNSYGVNSYRWSEKDLTLGATMIDPEESLLRTMAVLQTNTLDLPDAIRQMSREYNKVMTRFVTQLTTFWNSGTISTVEDALIASESEICDIVLTQIFLGRNEEFPFYNSTMGTFIETRMVSAAPFVYSSTPQPIYIPLSAAHIGVSSTFVPQKFTDLDGVSKIRGHDGSLIVAFGDARDDVILELENRFFDSVPEYMRTESTTISARYNAVFHLDDFYGNYSPTATAGTVVEVVNTYTAVVSPVAQNRIFSIYEQVYAIWNGTVWTTQDANPNDVFFNEDDSSYYIFNGFTTNQIPTWNNTLTSFDYSFNEYRQIVQREFERYVTVHSVDFITNDEFDEDNPFTWNYSSAGIEGNYRGIYRRIYHTVRPHSHPWEVVGYSIKPSWWSGHYAATSVASDGTPRYANTHQMWVDFQAGIVNPISGKIVDAYALVAPIPVDVSGELLDPIAAGVVAASALVPDGRADEWAYGDGSPVEETFYNSYFFQFSVALAGYLMKNPMFVERSWSEFYRSIGTEGSNLLWNGPAYVINNTLTRPQAADDPVHLSLDDDDNIVINPGLNAWIAEYTAIIGKSPINDFSDAIVNAQPVLGWKTSGFVNSKRTRIELLNGDEIPNEDLSVVLHQGPSTSEFYQSGVTIIRDIDGFRVYGTDVLNPYFRVELGAKPVKGGSVELTEDFTYNGSNRSFTMTEFTIPSSTNDTATFAVLINGYKINPKYILITSATTFTIDASLMMTKNDVVRASVVTTVSNPGTQIGSFVINGVQITYFNSGTGVYKNYSYGSLFESFNDVVNMLVGHGRYLSRQGWVFERLTNGVLRDWLGCAKTFADWATKLSQKYRGNAAAMKGQTFEFSVLGRQAQFRSSFGMILGIENIRNGSYGVVDVASQPIRGTHLNVVSDGGTITVSSDDTDIFGLRLYLSEVQHVIFFPNTTTFNDIIYEPALGLAQDVVFVDTYRTTNWNGRLETPGFLVVNGRLLPNWEKQTADISRYYDRFNPPDDPVLVGMSRNLFGYAPKNYLNVLAIDDRNQFNFFRGTLKSKGTFQPYKAFVRGTTVGTDNVTIAEDWAWKFNRSGDARIVSVQFAVGEDDFVDVFQAVIFDELSFSYVFTGDERTTCFDVPERFDSHKVVAKAGGLRALGADYTVTPIDSGNRVCFLIPPLHNQTVTISMNDNLVHAIRNVFYSSGYVPIDTTYPLRSANTIIARNGLVIASDDVTEGSNIVPVTPRTNIYAFANLGDDIFLRSVYTCDSYTSRFGTGNGSETLSTVIVLVDGLWLSPGVDYTLDTSNSNNTVVVLGSPPVINTEVVVIAAKVVDNVRFEHQSFTGNGSTTDFSISGITLTSYRQTIVTVSGLVQTVNIPSQSVPYTYSVVSGGIRFTTPPANGAKITIMALLDAVAPAIPPIQDDRVIHIPQFSPPTEDARWVISPPQEHFRDRPYRFPVTSSGAVDVNRYIFYAALIDLLGKSPALNLFHWDPAQEIHEPLALSKIDYRTPYDPARYNNGPLTEDELGLVWGQTNVGSVWWDVRTADYSDYTGFLPDYMRVTREWGRLKYYNATIVRVDEVATVTTFDPKTGSVASHNLTSGQIVVISGADQPDYNGTFEVTVGSSSNFTFVVYADADTPGTGDIQVQVGKIDVYEWVASPVLPASWDTYVSSQTGYNAYTGIVLNSDDPSYCTREVWDVNGNATTTYYFWVQSNTRIIPEKGLCVNDIAGRLKNPAGYEVPFIALMDPGSMFCFVGDEVVQNNSAIELTYSWYEMPRHVEWLLFGENDDFEQIPELVTEKLVDSILGVDIRDNVVPNDTLSPLDTLGTCYFPQQTVFSDKTAALDVYVTAVNAFLVSADLTNFPTVFTFLTTLTELENTSYGYWSKETFWKAGIDHAIVYDVVRDTTERNYRTSLSYYFEGDIVKVKTSAEVDLWTGDPVSAYYQYTDASWDLIGIEKHTGQINRNLALYYPDRFRDFFTALLGDIEIIDGNRIVFQVLFEMLRQNPVCDWFFKTSYIDPHITLPITQSAYVRPDQATAILDAILDLKPYRTKIRDGRVSYAAELEPIGAEIIDTPRDKLTLVFDRVARNLDDENAWDTIPWDATATYPESESLTLLFIGDGLRTCFAIPEIAPQASFVVLLNHKLAIPELDYHIDVLNYELCFTTAPTALVEITVMIDSIYIYSTSYEYAFLGDGVKSAQVLQNGVADANDNNVITTWDGVHQTPASDFVIQVTSDSEVVYSSTPAYEQVVGTVFGGTMDGIFAVLEFTSDGATSVYDLLVPNQDDATVIVLIDGVWQQVNTVYTIDSVSSSLTSYVHFVVSPVDGAHILFYVARYPEFMASQVVTAIGDGETVVFEVDRLISYYPAKVFVHLDGIEQSIEFDDYVLTDSGVEFIVSPAVGVEINIFAIWAALGTRLQAVPSPLTIQWDLAFWEYSDLGRQEFDFAGLFIGDGTTTGYSVPIPQATTTLYDVVLKFFKNGVIKTPAELGITVTVGKTVTAVNAFLSDTIDPDTYCAIYVSRGLVDGLAPTMGYQNPTGIVFEPTLNTYEHFFARLISKTFDPSSVLSGIGPPEERIETTVEDMFTVIVQTIPENFYENVSSYFSGVATASHYGTFAFNITSNPSLPAPFVMAEIGVQGVVYDGPGDISTGLEVTTNIIPGFGIFVDPWWPNIATVSVGTFTFDITSSIGQTGIEVQTQLAITPSAPVTFASAEAMTEFGDLVVSALSNLPGFGTGLFGSGDFGLAQTSVVVHTAVGTFVVQIGSQIDCTGLEAQTEFGSLVVQTDQPVDASGLAVITDVGAIDFEIASNYLFQNDIGFGVGSYGGDQFGAMSSFALTAQTGALGILYENDATVGVEAITQLGTLAFEIGVIAGVEVTAAISDFIVSSDQPVLLTGLEAVSAFSDVVPAYPLIGLDVTVEIGDMLAQINAFESAFGSGEYGTGWYGAVGGLGVEALGEVGSLIPTISGYNSGVEATTVFNDQPITVNAFRFGLEVVAETGPKHLFALSAAASQMTAEAGTFALSIEFTDLNPGYGQDSYGERYFGGIQLQAQSEINSVLEMIYLGVDSFRYPSGVQSNTGFGDIMVTSSRHPSGVQSSTAFGEIAIASFRGPSGVQSTTGFGDITVTIV